MVQNKKKNIEIDKIKSSIKSDYIDISNSLWQLGHKNPNSSDNTSNNLVLQPPIQGKYRDNYIFIDTLHQPKRKMRQDCYKKYNNLNFSY